MCVWHYSIMLVIMPEARKGKRETTSIKIDPELWKDVKIEAIREDMEVSDFVDRALRKELGKPLR